MRARNSHPTSARPVRQRQAISGDTIPVVALTAAVVAGVAAYFAEGGEIEADNFPVLVLAAAVVINALSNWDAQSGA